MLALDDFAALSQSKEIIEKMKKLETESVEYQHQAPLTDSIPFYISTEKVFEMINISGTVGAPRESYCPRKLIVPKLILFYSCTIVYPTSVK